MGRKIILLSDGTGNSAAKVWRTNVWRTFEALDLSGNDQVAFYDDGVGTSTFKPWAILGGAFGFGLNRNGIHNYKFVFRNYKDERDEYYGLGVSRWIVPLELPTHTLDRERVMRACQALSLDEDRTTFHPELWDEQIVPPSDFDPDKKRHIADEQISQVWFAGVHSNVGGGYPDDALAYIPLVWMMNEAKRCGLKFKSDQSNPPADPD